MTTHRFEVADKVILTKGYGKRPEVSHVTKVTKAGWVEVFAFPGTKFKPSKGFGCDPLTYEETGPRSNKVLLPFSEETLAKLNERAEAAEVNARVKEGMRKAEKEAREAEKVRELEEVKAACNHFLPTDHFLGAVDGSEMFTLVLPVKPEYAERKAGYEILVVRVKDKMERDWDTNEEVKKVEAHMTLANGSTHSFASYSGETYRDATEALWDCCRKAYHSW